MNGGLEQLQKEPYANKDYYGAVLTSPFGNDLLLELAKTAIDAEHLGRGESADLLCISFSSTDAIGHSWGPDSQEVLDGMLRADRVVAELLAHLDARLGAGRYLLVMTSDHGICPLPEASRARGLDAGRVSLKRMQEDANAILQQSFAPGGKDRWIEAVTDNWLYLNRKLLAQRGVKAADAEAALARGLKGRPGIMAVYTRTQLEGGIPADEAISHAVRRSFYADRSGDLTVVMKPYYVPGDDPSGTSHGSPHAYDTHVPLLVYGRSVRPGVRSEPVSPLAVAGILAAGLGVTPPAGAEQPMTGLFEPKP